MPQVSRNKLTKQTENELIESISLVLTKISRHEEMDLFLTSLLTDTEKIMLAKRLAVIVLLKEGMSDAEISGTLHLTRMTIAKMRYFYEARGQGYTIALAKLDSEERLKQLKKALVSLARYSIRAAGGYIKPPKLT